MHHHVLDIVERAYAFEPNDETWLANVLDVMRPALDHGFGCSAFFYDATNVESLRVWGLLGSAGPRENVMRAIAACTPAHVETNFRSRAFGLASESPVWREQPAAKLFRAAGAADVIFVNGSDPTGVGCFFTARVAEGTRVSPLTRTIWKRATAHIAAGFRLQRKLAATAQRSVDDVSAILTPRGEIQHAQDDAALRPARRVLGEAVRAIERSRGPLRTSDPEAALAGWRGLVAARWSLVDWFDRDGRRYVVARKNQVTRPAPDALTPRERQIVAYARMGHTNKLVAYALGISASTVGVLLSRAARKLGARSRAELFAAFDAAARVEGGDAADAWHR